MTRMRLAAALLVCVLSAGAAAAQCCGDCGNDGAVTINDLIVAVNNALNGCAAATPTSGPSPTCTRRPTATATPADRCPFSLTDNSGGDVCGFRGRYNRGCGNEVNSLLGTNGTTVVVAVATTLQDPQAVYFSAHVTDASNASLTAWATDSAFQNPHAVAGSVQLTDNGNQLVVFPNDPPFMILNCNFVQYTGTYTGHSGTNSAASNGLDGGAIGRALDGVEAELGRPIPDLAHPALPENSPER